MDIVRKLSGILLLVALLVQYQVVGQGTKQVTVTTNRGMLPYPWAGGMNSCQFGMMDLNMDGIRDLIVFDRCGNRIMPFIWSGREARSGYEFAGEFVSAFPELTDWAIFTDYNGDGKEDIFTFSPGYAGMKVYRNTSGQSLSFTLEVFPYLSSFQGGGYVNILVTYADYPAISDLDGDSDLDILTFYGLGSFVEMHRNMSVEKYGNRDSLDYVKSQTCWGYFAENEESNDLTLDTCSGRETERRSGGGQDKIASYRGQPDPEERDERHTGSTFQALDLNDDELPDLLLGDVDYPNLVALYNDGNNDTARMTSYEWRFPGEDQAVELFSMPAAFYADINRDGRKDLLVSPFDPNPLISDNIKSAWLYIDLGNTSVPQFHLQNKRFLQDDMIDFGAGAYPVLFDYNLDGLPDLFAGNYGRYDTSFYDQYMILHSEHTAQIALFENTGTATQPAFNVVTEDFAGISALKMQNLIPAFGDLDGDGDPDMLTGDEEGTLAYYENIAITGQPMEMVLRDLNYQGIDVGGSSAPVLFDLDGDGFEDLVIGERGGNLNYYRNLGLTGIPGFELITDSLGKINVTDYSTSLTGFSIPCLLRDDLERIHLMVGSEQGKIFYYPDIGAELSGQFKESEDIGSLIGMEGFGADRGYRTAPAMADIHNDGSFDLIAGNFSGGLEFFSKGSNPPVSGMTNTDYLPDIARIYPNPFRNEFKVENNVPEHYDMKSLEITDAMGRELSRRDGLVGSCIMMDLSCYPDGIYILRLTLCDKTTRNDILLHKKVLKKAYNP